MDSPGRNEKGFIMILIVTQILGLFIAWASDQVPNKKEEIKQPVIIVKNYITVPSAKGVVTFKNVTGVIK